MDSDVAVLGAGSFGTAIAAAISRSGFAVHLYCHRAEQAEDIRVSGENRRFFPGHRMPELIRPTNDLQACLGKSTLFLAFPAKMLDHYVEELAVANPEAIVVNLAKGLHPEHFTFAKLFEQRLPSAAYVALKGPTFARPMFLGELSGLTCGTASDHARARVVELFANSMVDLDFCSSAEAVDALSAIKNVYAVALGIGGSLDLSENTIYLLISRIVREVQAVLNALGGDSSALLTYSGLGDLLLTGMCDTSRNRTLGLMLGRGLYIDMARSGFLTEGVRSFTILKSRIGQDLPIFDTVFDIMEHRAEPIALLDALGLRHMG
ncbi:MAG: NAD(P)H-dependent glycerol-3-phosphate dehydrogenase [Sphingobium sp.]